MRYGIVTKDAVVPPTPDFSASPGIASPDIKRVSFARGAEFGDEPEDTVLPLFPEHDPFDDPTYSPSLEPPPLRGRVRLRLDEVAQARGLVTPSGRFRGKVNLSAISRGTGLAYATLHKTLREPEETRGITWVVLTRLCEFLHCTPGDLLVWEPRAAEPSTSLSDYHVRREARAKIEEGPGEWE